MIAERGNRRTVFRGLSDAAYKLDTTLGRLGHPPRASVEKHLLRNFRKYAHADFERTTEEWFWVALGQHHGLPTRLLDWTYSPHVALHFATSNTQNYDRDGEFGAWTLIWLSESSPPSPTPLRQRGLIRIYRRTACPVRANN